MNLLALETATSVCSVALLQDGHVTVHLTLNRPRAHAENLVPMIGDALRYAGLEASRLDAVAVSAGPGSYTGLRIGVSTAKGLAESVDCALVSVPSLEALAATVTTAPSGSVIAAAFDARRDEIYAAAYLASQDGRLQEFRETAAIRTDEAAKWLDDADASILLVGEGWRKMVQPLEAAGVRFTHLSSLSPTASAVARLGAAKLDAGSTEDLVTFEPYYLKDFVAAKPKATAFEKLSF